jgi:hypothetical protein
MQCGFPLKKLFVFQTKAETVKVKIGFDVYGIIFVSTVTLSSKGGAPDYKRKLQSHAAATSHLRQLPRLLPRESCKS